jgi:hypothetical protein
MRGILDVDIIAGPTPQVLSGPSAARANAGDADLTVNVGGWSLGGSQSSEQASSLYSLQAGEQFALAYAVKLRFSRNAANAPFAYVSAIAEEDRVQVSIPSGLGAMEIVISAYSL